jgi:L-alanine-DL-glutamate epimerase-like enolase superfamily enzyme
MKITEVALTPYVQPFQDKSWRFALASLSENQGLLIEIRTDEGPSGLGYAGAALHMGEVLDGMRQAVEQIFRPILVGGDPFDLEPLMERVDHAVLGYTRTKAAIEVALFDLLGKALNLPVYKLLGGLYRESIPVVRIVPIKSPLEMARNAEQVVQQGYKYLKVKVGLDARLDVERVREIRRAVGPDIGLTLDANQGWTPQAAIGALRRMEEFDIALIEQPVRSDDYLGLAQVKAAVNIVVEADESAKSLSDIFHLAQTDCVDAISLKTPKLGGLRNVKKGAAICQAANLRCRIGMGGATRLAAVADMHIIASTANIDFACEVGEFTRMESDPTDGVEIEDGVLKVPQVPGLGIYVREPAAALTRG